MLQQKSIRRDKKKKPSRGCDCLRAFKLACVQRPTPPPHPPSPLRKNRRREPLSEFFFFFAKSSISNLNRSRAPDTQVNSFFNLEAKTRTSFSKNKIQTAVTNMMKQRMLQKTKILKT